MKYPFEEILSAKVDKAIAIYGYPRAGNLAICSYAAGHFLGTTFRMNITKNRALSQFCKLLNENENKKKNL